jgi:hypothetical protein
MTNILFFPCNGHGVVATLQTMTAFSIAIPNLQINTLSTNCDSGGATGNDRIINERLFISNSKYEGWKNLALGDYMKLLMGFIKHKFTIEADNKTDIQVKKWVSFESELLDSKTRNNNGKKLIDQMQNFFELVKNSTHSTHNNLSVLENLLINKGSNLNQLTNYVNDYISISDEINPNEIKDNSDRGQAVWFYLLVNFLYNNCECNFSEINSIWQEIGIVYPNVNLGIFGETAHHLSYSDKNGKFYPEEDAFDNRSNNVSLDMSSSILYSSNQASLALDIQTIVKIQQADQIIIPLGSHETVYAYLKEYKQYLESKKVILIMNSNMTGDQKNEYNQMLRLLNQANLSELVLIGHPAEINSEIKLPLETKIKYVGHDENGKLRTETLNSEVIKQSIANLEISLNLSQNLKSVQESLREARLGSHLSVFKPYLIS